MSLLSRVADSFYWLGRYVERAENTARLLMAYSNMALDLPRRSRLDWTSVVEITGALPQFLQSAHNHTELGVMRFMIHDTDNPGSIVTSLNAGRENLRRTRDRVPREVSESMNTLHGFVLEHSEGSIRRTAARHAFLRGVVDHAQMLRGYTGGAMSHNLGYQFIRFGRLLERADMTSRIMDVRFEDLLPDDSGLPPAFEAIQWMAVLRSLSAYQMYRRRSHGALKGREVLDFLFLDPEFPRSVHYCLNQVRNCASKMPRSTGTVAELDRLMEQVAGLKTRALSADNQALRDTIDTLQSEINSVHNGFVRSYFHPDVGD